MSQRKLKTKRKEFGAEVMRNETVFEIFSIKEILKKNWLFLLITCLMVIAVYVNGLKGDFVSDDYATILNNPDIKSFGYALKGFPTVNLSNWLAAVLFGVSPIVFHTWSLLHYLVSIVVLFVFLRVMFDEKFSRIALLIFALHPVHVEAVAWNSGKPYLLLTIFTTISFLLLIKYLEKEKIIYAIGSVLSFVLAFLADNPRPFALLPILLIYFMSRPKDKKWKKLIKFWPVLLISVVVFIIIALPYIKTRVGVVNSGYNASESIFYNPFFQYPTGITKYLQLFFVPIDLTLYHTMFVFPLWLNWLIFLNYLGLMVYSFFKNKKIFFGLSFILVVIFPSMAPVKVSWLVAERYAFWPILGFAIFMTVIFVAIINKSKIIGYGLLSGMLLAYGARIIARNIDWSTNHNLWVNTCQVSPNSHNAWNNIGDDYDKLNDPTNAIKGFTQSTIVKPNYADAYHNRANIFFKIQRLDLARESYMTALNFSPSLYQTYLSLTQIDLMEGKADLALQHSQAALKLQPNNPQAAYVVGVVFAQVGKVDEAKQIFNAILQTYPTYSLASDALKNLNKAPVGSS